MKKLVLLLALAVIATAIACRAGEPEETISLPPQFKAQIQTLRDHNVELTMQMQDLQKKFAELQAEMSWNTQRMSTVESEALTKLGLSVNDYTVNVVKLSVDKVDRGKPPGK